jgi:hypothetical protein
MEVSLVLRVVKGVGLLRLPIVRKHFHFRDNGLRLWLLLLLLFLLLNIRPHIRRFITLMLSMDLYLQWRLSSIGYPSVTLSNSDLRAIIQLGHYPT